MGRTFRQTGLSSPAPLAALKRQIELLEDAPRRFSRTVSISAEVDKALPYHGLPLGCIHEVKGTTLAAAVALVALLSGRILAGGGHVVYVGTDRSIHPLGLLPYGLQPERLIHVAPRRSQDVGWAALEALRCSKVGAVLAVVPAADLTLCRRFQLAAEGSGVTVFLLGTAASAPAASVITRWRISSLAAPPGTPMDEPCWGVELVYCRGGRPGKWVTVWKNKRLESLDPASPAPAKRGPRFAPAAANVLAG